MLQIYLSHKVAQNQALLEQLDAYGVSYQAHGVEEIGQAEVLSLFEVTSDCFEILSPSYLTYKRRDTLSLMALITLVAQQPSKSLRLPLIVYRNHVYPAVKPDDLRTFIPRSVKVHLYWKQLGLSKS
ncbi:hypothetical protein [Streptococcus loxodontisalivarius]|uniref:Arsenate reductase-like glutaredoxin family protein n=1 Tax=Streptococcus loxodontisalivarius TaxID=1349415 RepID=A0ABS2PRA9_9STRE|nr:hypothetical protein [Streptococcus loxodontisalivarius]MBM7642034.1 arsenate reductase-like glutaredoxin family protein [Streptococcus loxodontisalivarius]